MKTRNCRLCIRALFFIIILFIYRHTIQSFTSYKEVYTTYTIQITILARSYIRYRDYKHLVLQKTANVSLQLISFSKTIHAFVTKAKLHTYHVEMADDRSGIFAVRRKNKRDFNLSFKYHNYIMAYFLLW